MYFLPSCTVPFTCLYRRANNISALSKLRETAEILAVWYTNLNCIVYKYFFFRKIPNIFSPNKLAKHFFRLHIRFRIVHLLYEWACLVRVRGAVQKETQILSEHIRKECNFFRWLPYVKKNMSAKNVIFETAPLCTELYCTVLYTVQYVQYVLYTE